MDWHAARDTKQDTNYSHTFQDWGPDVGETAYVSTLRIPYLYMVNLGY